MTKALTGVLKLAAAGVVAVAVLAIAAPSLLRQLNPFATETRDRSQPALLHSLQRLHEYRAARANLEQVVDIEHDAKYLPSFISGERTVMVAAGDVDASVDFRRLGPKALQVSDDRKAVTITLPPARLTPARLDVARSRVVSHDRGLADRTGDLLGGDTDEERQLLQVAQEKLDAAARADKDLLPAAQRNTAAMLRRLARGLGFERVTVRFQAPPAV